MAYAIERFGTTTLPTYDPETDQAPAPARNGVTQTVAGGFDSYGDEDAPMDLPYVRSFRWLVAGDTVAAWRTAVDALRALVRTRKKLYRRADDDEAIQWCYARLMQMPGVRQTDDKQWMEIELVFQIQTAWTGHDHSTWTLDDGTYLDTGFYLDEDGYTETMASSPHTITVSNGGNQRVDNAVLTITAGSAAITALTIAKTGETDIDYAGTIAIGQALVVDCGAFSIENNGTSDYTNFSLGGDHAIEEWLRLDAGDNDIEITFTGGSTDSTVLVEFKDGWA